MFEPFASHRPAPSQQEAIQHFKLHQIAQDLRLEIEHRAALEHYCQWYDQTAQQLQADYRKMQSEAQVLNWFRRN